MTGIRLQSPVRDIAAMIRQTRDDVTSLEHPQRPGYSLRNVLLKIESSSPLSAGSYRHEYTVKLVDFKESDKSFNEVQFEDGDSNNILAKAYNGWESTNTTTSALVLNGADPDDLPSDFDVEPLPNGLVCPGSAHYFSDADGASTDTTVYYFICEPNPISGTCP